MKVLSIVGARPQFIKEAIVGEALCEAGIEEILVNTGQHYDANISDVFIKGLSIKKSDYNLGVGSGTHAFQTAMNILSALHRDFNTDNPEGLFGDVDAGLRAVNSLISTYQKSTQNDHDFLHLGLVKIGLPQWPSGKQKEASLYPFTPEPFFRNKNDK